MVALLETLGDYVRIGVLLLAAGGGCLLVLAVCAGVALWNAR